MWANPEGVSVGLEGPDRRAGRSWLAEGGGGRGRGIITDILESL